MTSAGLLVVGLLAVQPVNWTAAEDHRNMLDQLGIKALRPGPSGNETLPNHANYDESKANPFPDLPDALTLKNGKKVTTPAMWWHERRPEIVEDFEREVYGRVPKNMPKVTWTVAKTENTTVGSRSATRQELVGHVDNSLCPSISVDIQMILVRPAGAAGPVPVMMRFGRGEFPQPAGGDPPASEQLIADGWGYAFINPTSIQADNGAGLTQGIIGLVNLGQPRKPDDWGALRAWAWGASRGLDYLETDKAVNAKQVGIEGVSRYGKAALVTMAFDSRFALVLVGSSGEGGAKLHRRNWGEAVQNLTGSGEYHWMAGNFLKYAGPLGWNDLPVDSHELVAMCAPRPVFLSAGNGGYDVEPGGDSWADAKGTFLAGAAASPAYELLGKKGTGLDVFPPMETLVATGDVAFRQHSSGHTDGPNWSFFLDFASKHMALPVLPKNNK